MARNASISVKDLTAALAIGEEKGKQEGLKIAATNDPSLLNQSNVINRHTRPDLFDDEQGTDPAEVFEQLTIPGLEGARGLQINPQVAHSPSGTYDRYGSPLDTAPWEGIDPGGNPIDIDHIKEGYQKEHKGREQLHDWKFHDGKEPSTYDKVGELLAELNPAQIEALKGIPSDLNTRSNDDRLNIMRSVTARVREAA